MKGKILEIRNTDILCVDFNNMREIQLLARDHLPPFLTQWPFLVTFNICR